MATRERRGWVVYDWSATAFILCVITVIGAQYFVVEFEQAAHAAGDLHVGPAAALRLFGLAMPAEAMWSLCVAAGALLIVTLSPIAGALADAWGKKRRFLQAYCGLGVASCLLLTLPLPWWAIAVLIVTGLVGYGGGNVFYNGFLPEIAAAEDQNAVSSLGFAAGYLGGLLVLILCLALFTPLVLGSALGPVRFSFGVVGAWWGGFALVTFSLLRDRPVARRPSTPLVEIAKALTGLLRTMRVLRHHPQALRFLLAYLLYNDGVATLISNVTPYALQNIYMDASLTRHIGTAQLGAAIILVQVVALPGALAFGWLSLRIGQKAAVLLTLAVFTGAVTWGLFAHVVMEFYGLAAAIGLVLGGCQAISRALFASLIPEGRTAEFFAFFAISDRVSAMLGPLIYGTLLTFTGNTRLALSSLAVFFVAGGALLSTVDVAAGRRFAQAT